MCPGRGRSERVDDLASSEKAVRPGQSWMWGSGVEEEKLGLWVSSVVLPLPASSSHPARVGQSPHAFDLGSLTPFIVPKVGLFPWIALLKQEEEVMVYVEIIGCGLIEFLLRVVLKDSNLGVRSAKVKSEHFDSPMPVLYLGPWVSVCVCCMIAKKEQTESE